MTETTEARAQRLQHSASHFANYQEYNKVLRTWFVSFGLGAPALFLVNEELGKKFHESRWHTWIVGLYLGGCAAQIVVALVNKFIAWHCHDDYETETLRDTTLHNWCRKYKDAFWIDMAADIVTAALFTIATITLVAIFA